MVTKILVNLRTSNDLFKELRPIMEGFVVTMQEGVCKTGAKQEVRSQGC